MTGDRLDVIIDRWSPDVERVLARPVRKALRITEGWRDRTLDRLVPFCDHVDSMIVESDTPDLSALSAFASLRELSVQAGLDTIDFSALRALETLRLSDATPPFGNLGGSHSLKVLSVNGGALSDLRPLGGLDLLRELEVSEARLRSLIGLENLKSLRRLALFDVPLDSLDGIERAGSLTTIGLHRLGRLRSIAPLTALRGLSSLEIDGCRKILDIERLGTAHGIEELTVAGTPLPSVEFLSRLHRLRFMTLQGVGRLASLEFLRSLHKLETLGLADNTNVVNGDLSILLELPALRVVSFADRRNYSHPLETIQAVLTQRGTQGPDSFDNYMAQQWLGLLQTRSQKLGRVMLAGVLNDTLAYGDQEISSRLGQYAIAAAEVLARLRGNHERRTQQAAALDGWVRNHGFEPSPDTVARAVEVLDRLLTPPSGLLNLWRGRGRAEEWIAAVNDLKRRLTSR